jgi:hypothetical protein
MTKGLRAIGRSRSKPSNRRAVQLNGNTEVFQIRTQPVFDIPRKRSILLQGCAKISLRNGNRSSRRKRKHGHATYTKHNRSKRETKTPAPCPFSVRQTLRVSFAAKIIQRARQSSRPPFHSLFQCLCHSFGIWILSFVLAFLFLPSVLSVPSVVSRPSPNNNTTARRPPKKKTKKYPGQPGQNHQSIHTKPLTTWPQLGQSWPKLATTLPKPATTLPKPATTLPKPATTRPRRATTRPKPDTPRTTSDSRRTSPDKCRTKPDGTGQFLKPRPCCRCRLRRARFVFLLPRSLFD